MPPKRKRKIDPQKIFAWYTFDLTKKCDWSGELSYSVGDISLSGVFKEKTSSIPSIKLSLLLESTNSKKVKPGSNAELNIFILDEDSRTERAGLINKDREGVEFSVWLPWKIANHLHLILISGKAKCLDILGTELYNRSATINSISLSRDYEEYCYESA